MRNWWKRTDDAVKVLLVCALVIVAGCVALSRMPDPNGTNGQSALMGFLIGQGAARR